MIRVHIFGLPRSGTTALSQAVAESLGLPLVVEPIFLWTDGFRVDLMHDILPDLGELKRIRSRIGKLDQVFESRGGFVEKTPSSVFLAPVLGEILQDSVIIVVTRDRTAIVKSLSRMIFERQDGNLHSLEHFLIRQLKVRFEKVFFLFRTLGPFIAFPALFRFLVSGRYNSVVNLSSVHEIEKFVDAAMNRLADLNAGYANRVMFLSYSQFRDSPDSAIADILNFCGQAPQSARGKNHAP